MKDNKPFTLNDVDKEGRENLKLNLQRDGDEYYSSSVLKRKTFLGMFPHWVVVADLLDPVRDVDKEIQKTKDKLVELETKRVAKLREFYTICKAIPEQFETKAFSLSGKPSKSEPVNDVFPGDRDKAKPKTRSVSTACVPASPSQNQGKNNNQNKR
jgi:hypothetical protein